MVMTGGLRALSIYEGFFSGGARILHSAVVAGLHEDGGQVHSVLSIHRAMRRETMRQRMQDDHCFRLLSATGVRVASLNRTFDGCAPPPAFSSREVAIAAGHVKRADIVLSLKEQPLHLINRIDGPITPVIVCLHRSDPDNQGGALRQLRAAVAAGRIAAAICCADATRSAYRAAGIPDSLLHTIPNGVDLARFRPVRDATRAAIRRSLGVPAAAALIAFAARYDAMKNVPLFLRSARAFLEREPFGHVMMCGPGMRKANVELCLAIEAIFADAPALRRRLHLLGLRHDMETIYAAADVVTRTSTNGEAAPLSLIEGMMCGAVPVATDVGDCASIVAGHGLIAPPDPDAMAAAWLEAIARRSEYTHSLALTRPRFSHTRMIASYAALISAVSGARRAIAPGSLELGV
jgi:glycosyltransferase involved in cell wall biosynthesis